ncbi:unnamed protein product [Vitrella brassicaformis CCMP3155]|uniref:Uncharacterized protein n=1 Tax=Vitrella brassicaformis (strain CCMP3155) TaxID=1169540 RepID=A0A0G4EUR7_VITBC|nr:unnamed protein product [Vitrella brassicaformis CCMP3155]|eukprot:CEM02340.1 unnamed protein product [Vitrella brassicaformis CCMP3155]
MVRRLAQKTRQYSLKERKGNLASDTDMNFLAITTVSGQVISVQSEGTQDLNILMNYTRLEHSRLMLSDDCILCVPKISRHMKDDTPVDVPVVETKYPLIPVRLQSPLCIQQPFTVEAMQMSVFRAQRIHLKAIEVILSPLVLDMHAMGVCTLVLLTRVSVGILLPLGRASVSTPTLRPARLIGEDDENGQPVQPSREGGDPIAIQEIPDERTSDLVCGPLLIRHTASRTIRERVDRFLNTAEYDRRNEYELVGFLYSKEQIIDEIDERQAPRTSARVGLTVANPPRVSYWERPMDIDEKYTTHKYPVRRRANHRRRL